MAINFKGTVRQATPQATVLTWKPSQPWSGNEIKFSSITALDVDLDTSRFHFSLPVRGKEPYYVDGKFYQAGQGEYFIFNTQQEARAAGVFKEKVEGYCIFITEQTINEVARAIGMPLKKSLASPFHHTWQQHAFLTKTYDLKENSFGQYLHRLRYTLQQSSGGQLMDWDAFYFSLAEQFLLAHRQINRHLRAIPSASKLTRREIYRRISLAHCYILDNFAEPFSLDELTRVAFFSKYHIVRLYKKIYGRTPYQHVLQLRIEKAKELLMKNYSPTEVAMQLSFADRRSFGKVFKRLVGVAPSAY
ncbi:MAG: AraC family transcriptional regulator [Bacteroidota bacterium]